MTSAQHPYRRGRDPPAHRRLVCLRRLRCPQSEGDPGHRGRHGHRLPRGGHQGLLTFGHGAPLRLRNESQLGFKQVKWVKGVEFIAHFSEIGGGHGGYNPDHEFFGYRQTL